MKKQYITDLADLYTNEVEVITENVEAGKADTNLDTPPKGLKDDGTGRVEGLVAPIDNDDDSEEQGISNKGITQKKEIKKEKPGKLNEKSISNCKMSKTNIFDKLYATIMEDEDLDDNQFGSGLDDLGDEESDLDELGIEDEAGSEVTVTLTAEEADLLKSIVDKLGGEEDLGGEDDLDFGDIGDGEEEDPLMEGGATESVPEGKADNPKSSNAANGTVKPKGGTADGKAATKVDDGKPKDFSKKHGDNKPGPNTVGNSSAEWG